MNWDIISGVIIASSTLVSAIIAILGYCSDQKIKREKTKCAMEERYFAIKKAIQILEKSIITPAIKHTYSETYRELLIGLEDLFDSELKNYLKMYLEYDSIEKDIEYIEANFSQQSWTEPEKFKAQFRRFIHIE